MKANVVIKEQKIDTAAQTIVFDAIDLETIKNAVNQWRVKQLRDNKRFEIVSIIVDNK